VSGSNAPIVTAVVVANERFGLAERWLDGVACRARAPVRVVCVDAGSPCYVRERLEERAQRGELDLIRCETFLKPNVARNLGLARVNTPYVVFVDGETEVAPGWLAAMVGCAAETGAAIVSPVHLEGRLRDGLILSARRGMRIRGERPHAELDVDDPDAGRGWAAGRNAIGRGAIAFPLSSCALVRRDLLDRIGPLDESLLPGLDGIDLALRARDAGASIVLEPAALVAHPAPGNMVASDVPWFRTRWSDEWLESSRERFAERWGVAPDRGFLGADMAAAVTRRRSVSIPAPDGPTPRLAEELPIEAIAQVFPHLLAQCRRLAWRPEEIGALEDAYIVAAEMFGDAVVDFGRPFLCHSTATTSIVTAYGARADLAVATLLHSSYSHGFFPRQVRATADSQRRYLVEMIGARAEALIAEFVRLGFDAAPLLRDPDRLPLDSSLATLMWLVNLIDGVRDVEQPSRAAPFNAVPEALANGVRVAQLLGVPGLAATFLAQDAKGVPNIFLRRVVWSGGHGRLSPVGERILPMSNESAPFPIRRHLLAAGGGRISVVVVPRGGMLLDRTIESALDQTYAPADVIVVDDGSPGLAAIANRDAGRVVVVPAPAGGQAEAWSAGLARSSGDIVMFLDGDCLLDPEACETIVDAWEPHLGRLDVPLDAIDDHLVSLRLDSDAVLGVYPRSLRVGPVAALFTPVIGRRAGAGPFVDATRVACWNVDAPASDMAPLPASASQPPAAGRRLTLGDHLADVALSGVKPNEHGAVSHGDQGVTIACDERQWAYSALLPLGLPQGLSGPAVLRLDVIVRTGQLGIGVLAGDRMLIETSAADRSRVQELILPLADVAESDTVVLRSWVTPPTRTEAILLRADLWRLRQ
jgi:GT2 family glycosyltransferase